jgi:hypothetical protein
MAMLAENSSWLSLLAIFSLPAGWLCWPCWLAECAGIGFWLAMLEMLAG